MAVENLLSFAVFCDLSLAITTPCYLRLNVEVHQLSTDNRHRPIIGRLFVLVSKTTRNAFNCSSHWWQWGN